MDGQKERRQESQLEGRTNRRKNEQEERMGGKRDRKGH